MSEILVTCTTRFTALQPIMQLNYDVFPLQVIHLEITEGFSLSLPLLINKCVIKGKLGNFSVPPFSFQ